MRVLNEERIPQVDVFFLPDPKDRLRLSFPMLTYSTLLSQCKYFHATVGYGRKRIVYLYIWKGLRLVGCRLEIRINIPEPGRLN